MKDPRARETTAGPFWDAYAAVYDALPKRLPAYSRMLAQVCDALEDAVPPPAVVLDAGCGTGNYSIALAERGYRVTAIDGSAAMLRRTDAKARRLGIELGMAPADLSRPLPFGEARFDAIVCVMVLYAVPEPPSLLAEMCRVARPGGVLALVTTDARSFLLPAARDVLAERGLARGILDVAALAGVGVANAAIEARFESGYHAYSAHELGETLGRTGWLVERSEPTYLEGAATLSICRAGLSSPG